MRLSLIGRFSECKLFLMYGGFLFMTWDLTREQSFPFLMVMKNQYFKSQPLFPHFLVYPKSNLQERPWGIVHNCICGGMIFSYVVFKGLKLQLLRLKKTNCCYLGNLVEKKSCLEGPEGIVTKSVQDTGHNHYTQISHTEQSWSPAWRGGPWLVLNPGWGKPHSSCFGSRKGTLPEDLQREACRNWKIVREAPFPLPSILLPVLPNRQCLTETQLAKAMEKCHF